MLRDLLLVLNILVCLALIGVVLLQRSEGGALGTGSPTGLVTARGAGDLLTRTTWVLFTCFLGLSLALTLLGGHERSSQEILDRLKHATVNPATLDRPVAPTAPAGAPSQAPAQSAPPALQLPPLGGPAPKARPAHAAANGHQAPPPVINAPPNPTTPNLGTPAPLALPPLGAPTNTPAKSPAP